MMFTSKQISTTILSLSLTTGLLSRVSTTSKRVCSNTLKTWEFGWQWLKDTRMQIECTKIIVVFTMQAQCIVKSLILIRLRYLLSIGWLVRCGIQVILLISIIFCWLIHWFMCLISWRRLSHSIGIRFISYLISTISQRYAIILRSSHYWLRLSKISLTLSLKSQSRKQIRKNEEKKI